MFHDGSRSPESGRFVCLLLRSCKTRARLRTLCNEGRMMKIIDLEARVNVISLQFIVSMLNSLNKDWFLRKDMNYLLHYALNNAA